MARLIDLKQTSATFQVSGIVTGTKSKKFYNSGNGANGNAWNAIEFGVKINDQKTVYCKLNGYTRDKVYYYKKAEEKGAKGISQGVEWKNRQKSPGEGFRLIGVNITVGKDEKGKNINETMTEWDAVEYIHDNWADGISVFINGNMVFSSYEGKDGQMHRKVELVPTQIYLSSNDINFNADDYKENAEFENTLVFSGIDKETGDDGKNTGRFILSGFSIGYNSIENVSFIIEQDHAKLASNFKKKMRPGYAIKTFGRISIVHNIEEVEPENDGWNDDPNEVSPFEKRVGGSSRTEYVIYKVDPDTFDTETYDEDAIAAAVRKIKAEKEAKKNFGEKAAPNVSADDWNDDDSDDDDEPWD